MSLAARRVHEFSVNVCVKPGCGGKGKMRAPDKTGVPLAGVFADSPDESNVVTSIISPCQTLKKAAVRSHPRNPTSHQSDSAPSISLC